MTQFQHLHPEFKDGKWTVKTTIPKAGDYELYFDIAPQGETASVLRLPIRIGSDSSEKAFPVPNPFFEAEAQGIRANLAMNSPFIAGTPDELIFRLTKDGTPLKTIDPYLGAFGHVVILKQNDASRFLHVHPITTTSPTNGEIRFGTTFPSAGRYTLFAQFNADGAIRTFPLTVDVRESAITPSSGAMEDHSSHH